MLTSTLINLINLKEILIKDEQCLTGKVSIFFE